MLNLRPSRPSRSSQPSQSSQPSPRGAGELIDPAALSAELKVLAQRHAGRERELRSAVAQRLKTAHMQARARADDLLLKDRHGRRCAERLAVIQDGIIPIPFQFPTIELFPSPPPSHAPPLRALSTPR